MPFSPGQPIHATGWPPDGIGLDPVQLRHAAQGDRLRQRQIPPDQEHGILQIIAQLLRRGQRIGIVQQRLKFLRIEAARSRLLVPECVEKVLLHIGKEQLAAHAGKHGNIGRFSQLEKFCDAPARFISKPRLLPDQRFDREAARKGEITSMVGERVPEPRQKRLLRQKKRIEIEQQPAVGKSCATGGSRDRSYPAYRPP